MTNFLPRAGSAICLTATITIIFLLAGCGPSQEEVRNELREMGYSFEKESFFEANARGEVKVVELFLQAGMSPNVETRGGKTPLHFAAKAGREKVVEVLLASEANVNARTQGGETPLHFAARAGRTEVTEMLLGGGANPDAQPEEPYAQNEGSTTSTVEDFVSEANTALMYAALRGDTETVKVLINNGADPNVRTKSGYTALLLAAVVSRDTRDRDLQTETIKILLRNGANPNVKAEGFTPLIMAVKGEDEKVFNSLVKNGVNPNIGDENGETALLTAVKNEQVNIIKTLLKNGADPNVRNDFGQVPLVWASGNYDSGIARLLLNNGANPDITGMEGQTPLIVASYRGREETVKLLLKKGAKVDKKHRIQHPNSFKRPGRRNKSHYGRASDTALDIARREGKDEIEKILIENRTE